jgi:uracil-DNA glycosylase
MDLRTINFAVLNCRSCEFRKNIPDDSKPIPGHGSKKATIMFISKTPELDCHVLDNALSIQNQMLFHKMLEDAGISKDDVYFTYMTKCHTTSSGKVKLGFCSSLFLEKELEVVKPKFVVAMGVLNGLELDGYDVISLPSIHTLFTNGKKLYEATLKTLKELK